MLIAEVLVFGFLTTLLTGLMGVFLRRARRAHVSDDFDTWAKELAWCTFFQGATLISVISFVLSAIAAVVS